MQRFRYSLRLALAFLSRFKGVLILGVSLGFLIFVLMRFFLPILFGNTNEKIGLTGRYHVNELPAVVLAQIGEGLTNIDESGNVTAGLASSWETPDEGKTWIFHLDDDKKWQDGKAVTAEAVQYSFEDVEIQTPDPQTIIFVLETAFSPFPTVVAKPTFKQGLLGTGEWRVTNLSLVGAYVERISMQDTEGNKKTIKFYPTEERTKLAFKLGEIDTIVDLVNPEPFTTWRTVNIEETPKTSRYVAVFFNTDESGGVLGNKSIRQALSYAIDKGALGGQRALGPISPVSWGYNPQVKPYTFDAKRAVELIEGLGLPEEQMETLSVKLTTTPILLDVAEKIADYWRAVGMKTEVQVTSSIPEEYEAFLAIYDVSPDPDQYSTWHSTQTATNISRYKNQRIDKLLEDGRLELDQGERKEIYFDFQRFLLEDSPAAFLYHPVSYAAKRL